MLNASDVKKDEPTLRRPHVPRVTLGPRPASRKANALPGFLVDRLKEDRLEQAIRSGHIWCDTDDPIRIRGFDLEKDILSLVFDTTDHMPKLTVKTHEGTSATYLYADEKLIVVLLGIAQGFSLRNVTMTRFAA